MWAEGGFRAMKTHGTIHSVYKNHKLTQSLLITINTITKYNESGTVP